jgi:uncharacterized protein YdaU (DUF1376 family)
MNYYRRYAGDYLRDTARLSLTEHGAYTLMLDYYYSDAHPLPLDREEICRMVRAFKSEECKAVDTILHRYFERREDGYHNARADDELQKAAPFIEAARENGKKGGRRKNPSDNPVGNPKETEQEPGGLPGGQHPPAAILQPPRTTLYPPAAAAARAGARDPVDKGSAAAATLIFPEIFSGSDCETAKRLLAGNSNAQTLLDELRGKAEAERKAGRRVNNPMAMLKVFIREHATGTFSTSHAGRIQAEREGQQVAQELAGAGRDEHPLTTH